MSLHGHNRLTLSSDAIISHLSVFSLIFFIDSLAFPHGLWQVILPINHFIIFFVKYTNGNFFIVKEGVRDFKIHSITSLVDNKITTQSYINRVSLLVSTFRLR